MQTPNSFSKTPVKVSSWLDYSYSRKDFIPLDDPFVLDVEKALKFFGIDPSERRKCPKCDNVAVMVNLIPHLNDKPFTKEELTTYSYLKNKYPHHDMSLKEIGLWLKSIGH